MQSAANRQSGSSPSGSNTAPQIADLHAWLDTTLRRTSGRSDTAKAIRYSLIGGTR
jgi:hypothetical protein